jgi:hypothetical protein
MGRAKGVQSHPLFKLGKAAAAADERNLKLGAVLRTPLKVPARYDVDVRYRGIPTPMFGNDQYGCCVISGRAHHTLRFEKAEQKKLLKITEAEVVAEYLEQTGGADEGLEVLPSLKRWRKMGWTAAGDRYFIKAFAEIDRMVQSELKRAVYMDLGVGIGLRLPKSAEHELAAGLPWATTTGSGSVPNSWGGHYVYVTGYSVLGPTCVTWGRKQQMTWRFFERYCDEAYAIIDALNTPKKRKGIDARRLDMFLESHGTANAARPSRPTGGFSA